MRTRILLICCLVFLAVSFNSCTVKKNPDRKELISLMEKYLEALPGHNPSALPLAKDVRMVENTEPMPVGKGLWETATGGPAQFKIFVADSVEGQVAFLGVVEEKNIPVILGARLKVVNGEITEIDHLIIHSNGQPLNPNMSQVRPIFLSKVDPADRNSREEMMRIANSYYEALVGDDGKIAPFADSCQRRENGAITSYYINQTPEEAEKDDFHVFRQMTSSDQISTGVQSIISDINNRRFIAVDEKLGLVFAYSIFRHTGEPKIVKITGVPGITERVNKYGPFDLPAAHVFKICKGKIQQIEAIGYVAQSGVKNGWD